MGEQPFGAEPKLNKPAIVPNAVEVTGLTRHYGTVTALEEVSFSTGTGELFGFIGPDGAGKTTLFRILVSLLLPDSGIALVEGMNVVKDYKKLRRIIGYMPGRFSLYQDLTVEENLRFFATIFGTTIEENYHLIRDIYIQIEPFKDRKAGKLSGGMKQKLALSCALIHKPRVLFLDEPTTGVDAVSRREFWDMLYRLKQMGISILVSTPYMDEASMCDRVALIQNGQIMQINTPASIIDGYPHPLFAVTTGDTYKVMDELAVFPATYSAFAFGHTVHLSLKSAKEDVAEVSEYLQAKGFHDFSIERVKANIEDCFMDLMKKKSGSVTS